MPREQTREFDTTSIAARVADVVDRTIQRRALGEDIPDEQLIALHPELMPVLGEQLRILRLLDEAERGARDSGAGRRKYPSSELGEIDAGRQFGRDALPGYEILREIQRGGQGVIYEAVQKNTGRSVAIKVLSGGRLAGSQRWARFEREVEVLARLQHPNIVAIHDRGVIGQLAYFAMDYIDGRSLDNWIADRTESGAGSNNARDDRRVARESGVSMREALHLFARICEAVDAAHLRGVIHRDLKPSNIRIDASGAPHVLDFGLAKLVTDDSGGDRDTPALTITGQFVGSLPWASPEQAEGRTDAIDIRTDVYSLGVMLYQMLTGRFPYPVAGAMREVVQNIANVAAAPPRAICREIDDEVETIVLRSLQKDPARRYQSAGDLGRDVGRYLAGEPIEAKRDSGWYLLRKIVRRHRTPVVLAACSGAIITISAAALLVMYGEKARLLVTAQRETHRAERAQQLLQRTLDAVTQIGRGADVALKRTLLADLEHSIEPELIDQPELEAAVRDALGRTYQGLGLYPEAEEHLRAALAIRVKLYGRENLDVAMSLHNLAELERDCTRPGDAEPLFREALAIRQKLRGEEHVETATTLYSLAETVQGNRKLDEAEPLHRRALALFQTLRGPEHPDIARCLTGLGLLMTNREDYHAAEPYFRDALAMNRRLLGNGHPEVAGSVINLAKSLHVTGDYAVADALFRAGIATYRTLLGDEHDNVAWGLHRYALLLQSMGEYTQAAALLREALATYRKTLGDDDPYVARTLNSLGTVLLDAGDYAAAEPQFEEALDCFRRRQGGGDPRAWALNRLGELRQLQGDDAAAEPLLRAALADRGDRSHIEHGYLIRTLNSLAALLMKRGELAEAEALLREALELRRGLLGDEHPDVADSRSRLAEVLIAEKRYAEAEPLAAQGYDRLNEALGERHPWTIAAARRLQDLRQAASASATPTPSSD